MCMVYGLGWLYMSNDLMIHEASALLDLRIFADFIQWSSVLCLDVVQLAKTLTLMTLISFQCNSWCLDGRGIEHFLWNLQNTSDLVTVVMMNKNTCSLHGKNRSVSRRFSFPCFYFYYQCSSILPMCCVSFANTIFWRWIAALIKSWLVVPYSCICSLNKYVCVTCTHRDKINEKNCGFECVFVSWFVFFFL